MILCLCVCEYVFACIYVSTWVMCAIVTKLKEGEPGMQNHMSDVTSRKVEQQQSLTFLGSWLLLALLVDLIFDVAR